MLSLAQLSSKYAGAAPLKKGERAVRLPENDDDPAEWDNYLQLLDNSATQGVVQSLISDFTRKSKEQGECVKYLKKLLMRTHKMCNGSSTDISDKSVMAVYCALFDLAQLNWSLPSQIIDDMMTVGMNAIRDYSSSILSDTIRDYCLRKMRGLNETLTCRWIEMFGRFMVILNERGDIPHEGDVIKGNVFRQHIVEEICRMDWSQKNVVSLLTILEEMPGLEGLEIDTVMEKFTESLVNMSPAIVNSSVTQIITIAGNIRPALVLQTFNKYFLSIKATETREPVVEGSRKYGKKQAAPKRVSLGTMACNFVDASRHCDPIVREILKLVKASVYDHTLVMTPFTLAVVLAMTSVDYLRVSIVDPLKTSILRNYHELNLCQSSSWYKDAVGEIQDDIVDCFKAMISDWYVESALLNTTFNTELEISIPFLTFSVQFILRPKSLQIIVEFTNAMEYMSEGLKDLGIGLLNASSLQWKYPRTFKRCRDLGSYLIISVVLNNKEQLGLLLKELLKPESAAHIECLASCLSQCSRAVGQRDFQGRISELLQHLPSMSVESASAIVKSLMPSLQISPMLLDQLMIVLRKTFWKSIDAGRICVEVMCVILSNSRVVGNSQLMGALGVEEDDLIFSQFTQGNSLSNNDYSPLCHEILDLAKRFFLLDSKVREQLYLGLHRVARRNPILNDIIGGQLFGHVSQYLSNDDDSDNLIVFKSLFEFSTANCPKVKLKDELGFVVQCLGFVYNKSHGSIDQQTEPASVRNCKQALKKWIEFGCKTDLHYLEMVASAIIGESGLQGPIPDDVIRYVKVTLILQTLQIFEALIEFVALADKWPHAKQAVRNIFKRHHELEKQSKEPSPKKGKGEKAKGKSAPKKANATKVTQTQDADIASVTSGSENTAAPKVMKMETAPRPAAYFGIINLDSVCQMLREIYGPENKTKALGSVRGVDDFELLLLNTVKDKVARLKLNESTRERQRSPVDSSNSLTVLVETIWARLCKMEEVWKNRNGNNTESILSEGSVVVGVRLEVICNVLELFYSEGHSNRILYFNDYLGGKSRDQEQACSVLFDQWISILEMVTCVFDGLKYNGNSQLFSILNTVCKVLATGGTLTKIHKWCWEYMREDTPEKMDHECPDLLEQSVSLFTTCNTKCVNYSTGTGENVLKLAKAVLRTRGDVAEDVNPNRTRSSWLFTYETAPTLQLCIIKYIDRQIEMLNSMLGRLKAHRQYLGTERTLEMREKCIKMIDSLRSIATELVRSHFPAGPCVGQMLKLITQYYSSLSYFAEHLLDLNKYTTEHCPITSFKCLVAELGNDFKPRIETMIQHIEYVQRNQPQTTKSKAPTVKHHLSKDARLIPNMVYHMERFDQFVIALSKKVEVNMLAKLKLSTARDFRVEGERFRDALAERDRNAAGRPNTADTIALTASSRPVTAASTRRRKRKQ